MLDVANGNLEILFKGVIGWVLTHGFSAGDPHDQQYFCSALVQLMIMVCYGKTETFSAFHFKLSLHWGGTCRPGIVDKSGSSVL